MSSPRLWPRSSIRRGRSGSSDGASAVREAATPALALTRADPPAILRPQCLARERLKVWRPASHPESSRELEEGDLLRVFEVMGEAWSASTLEVYGSGLYAFHVFCDARGIQESARAPASVALLSAFLAELAGVYAKTTITNYIAGVRAWHLLHDLPWLLD